MSVEQPHTGTRRRVLSLAVGTLATGAVAGLIIAAAMLPSGQPATPAQPAAQAEESPVNETIEAAPEIVEPEPFDYGECPPTARACVDLDGERAWLQHDGEVTYGAVPIGQGGPGYDTPRAEFHVSRKVEYDVSYVFDMAPMPYAVYFTNVGHAFHEGDPEGDSHGCVRLAPGDAEVFYNELQIYDTIHIY